MWKVCESCLYLKKVINILSASLLSTNEKRHLYGNFFSDSKHIVHLKALNIYCKVYFVQRVFSRLNHAVS